VRCRTGLHCGAATRRADGICPVIRRPLQGPYSTAPVDLLVVSGRAGPHTRELEAIGELGHSSANAAHLSTRGAGDAYLAVVLFLVDQTVTVGNGTATNTASSVRVDKVDGRWLITVFDPVVNAARRPLTVIRRSDRGRS
jgi:hypothetical protein